jgi:hypothetical protein
VEGLVVWVVGADLWFAVAFPLEEGIDLFGEWGHAEEIDLVEAFVDVVVLGEIDHGVEIVPVVGEDLVGGVAGIGQVEGSYHVHQIVADQRVVVALVPWDVVVGDVLADHEVAGHTVVEEVGGQCIVAGLEVALAPP